MDGLKIDSSWKNKLKKEFDAPYFHELMAFLAKERSLFDVFPPENEIFACFNHTPFEQVKVVLLGQDPYHGTGQANGLSFAVNHGIRKPPSLVNIFKELQSDIGCAIPESGNLVSWADQGVLLLNTTLSVRAGVAGSHQKKGWEQFTDNVIQELSHSREHLVFLLWGNFARSKASLINREKHLILEASHPSPLARGAFFGSKPFSQTNEHLMETGQTPIDWGTLTV